MPTPSGKHPHHRVVAAAIVASCAAPAILAAPAGAQAPVTSRGVLEVNRLDGPTSAALPDGRVLLGWTNGNNNGDTTLAMVRPAGGVLPSAYQTLRSGYSGDDLKFVTGGPADSPAFAAWHDGASRSPFRVTLAGDVFTAQANVLGSAYSTGRFPRFARCPDGTTAFAYQYTVSEPPAPTRYYAIATRATANGLASGASASTTSSPDAFQDPEVTCDQGVALFSTANDADGQSGAASGDTLRVDQLNTGSGSTTVFTRALPATTQSSSPAARVAPDGRVFIVWSEYAAGATTTFLSTRAAGATGAVTAPAVFATGAGLASQVFFDAAGRAHLLLGRENGAGAITYSMRTAPAGSAVFGAEQPVATGSGYARVLTDHPDGNPRLLVSTPVTGQPTRYQVRGIPEAGSGSTATDFTVDADGSPTFSFLPSGDLFAAEANTIAPERIELREGGVDTGLAPTLDAVAVPGLVAGGEPTPIAISAKDPLGLSAFSWTVTGGGLPAPLTLATQSATLPGLAPGSYTATARAVDRAGNASTLARTFRVLDPAAVPPTTPQPATPRDTTKPRLSKVSATRGRRGKARAKITVRLTANEAAAANLELIGTLERGTQKGTLVLRSATVKRLAARKAKRVAIAVPSRLTRLVKNRLRVRLTVTDSAGNRATRTVAVKKAKR